MELDLVGNNTDTLSTAIQTVPGVKFAVEWLAKGIGIKIFHPTHEHVKMLDPTTLQNADQFQGAGTACAAFTPIQVRYNSPSCHGQFGTDHPPAGMEEFIIGEVRKALETWLSAKPPQP